jgi:hypothetical protein
VPVEAGLETTRRRCAVPAHSEPLSVVQNAKQHLEMTECVFAAAFGIKGKDYTLKMVEISSLKNFVRGLHEDLD